MASPSGTGTTRRVVKTVEGIPPEAVERGSLVEAPRLRQIDVRMSDGSRWTYWAKSASQFEQTAKTYRAINVGIPGASPAGWRIATAHIVAWRLEDAD